MKFALPLGDDLRLQFALQFSDQQGTGDNLLRGVDFSSEQWGGKAELGVGGRCSRRHNLSLYGLWVKGSDPQDPGQFAKDEYDLNLQWALASGPLRGLTMRLRYAHVSQDDPANTDLDELRVMIYYDPASL